ncbi:MAG: hypothetical protein BWY71_00248 [Planctomycetes bacterium ADurb.Bin412]|nr:MAG: hypothetical protein BWY71_00248 [Planctomycetes bacterium ADurb.Bin412]
MPGDLTPAERSNHTIPMQIVMHMTDPWDNERIDSHGIGEYPTHRAPLPFAWDAMPQASKYQIQIDIYRDGDHPLGYGRKNTVVDTETADLSYVADLPLSQPLEHYQTYLRAYDSSDNVLGYLMVTSSGGAYGWDYRFKICPLGDLNTDCCVDLLDLALLADNWLAGTGS